MDKKNYKKKYLKYKHKYAFLKNSLYESLGGGKNDYENVTPSGLAIRSGTPATMPPTSKPQLPQAVIKVAELKTQSPMVSTPSKPPGVYENIVIGVQSTIAKQPMLSKKP